MSNSEQKTITRLNALLIILATISACIILLSIILHVKLVELEHDLEDFATHHYFLTGFISLTVMLVCIRLYNDTPDKVSSFNILKKQTRNKRLLKKIERIEQYKKQLRSKIENAKSKIIEKENVGSLSFLPDDVLLTLDDLKQRESDLNNALKLGNTYKHKVKIYFKDTESNKHLETTIWQVDNQNIVLKSGIVLPVKSIYKVEI
ncbi:MAG: hypothetical protein Q7W45_15680 [Bacteroidota bacterium]|nr:hypothetical protein [Bacteroidota bacterium]MDP3145545.1 hypothetical protein [Bacteroidota bacterium]